jgi:site-specific DNA-methyltransferase (adenine-specific)
MSDILQPAFCQTPCYVQPGCQLYNEDCIETMKRIPDGSIDLLLQDPPYGVTDCEWDNDIDLQTLWVEWKRIIKPNGAMIFTCTQPFTSVLVMSNLKQYKFHWVWDKKFAGNFALKNYQPQKIHEDVIVFGKNTLMFNAQTTKRRHSIKAGGNKCESKSSSIAHAKSEYDDKIYDTKQPESILYFPRDLGRTEHPTQKPIDLFRYLVRTYSKENDLVFDGYSGSGTTAATTIKEKRRFIGSELSKEYFDKSVERLELLRSQPELF